MKLESAESSSLEDRVKRNIHSIQRTPASLDNFMKRWKGILYFKMTRTSQPFSLFDILKQGVLFCLSLYMVTVMYIKNETYSQTLYMKWRPLCNFLNFTMGMYCHSYSEVAGSLLIVWLKLCTVYSFSFYIIRASFTLTFLWIFVTRNWNKIFFQPSHFIWLPY